MKGKKVKGKKAATDEKSAAAGPAVGSNCGSLRRPSEAGVAVDLRATVPQLKDADAPKVSPRSAAMRERWRKIRAGEVPHPDKKPKPASDNPLLDLPQQERGRLFAWLRECPYDEVVLKTLQEQGYPDIERKHLNDFFQVEADLHWQHRVGRAAQEADALVQLVERSPVKFSAGILAALGQEAFRQVASGNVAPESMGRLATLFLRARSDERADQMQELKREKMKHDLKDQFDEALEALAAEVDKHPAAARAFAELLRELKGEG